MPELSCRGRRWQVEEGANLLDALNAAGMAVPYSCRAGSCHACLVQCTSGQPEDAQPQALDSERHAQGWRLACQCRMAGDLAVTLFDPLVDGVPATVQSCHWLAGEVLQLRLQPARPLRYAVGQHLLLWLDGVARPYSFASLPDEDTALEFHIDCRKPGAFADALRRVRSTAGWRLASGMVVRCTTIRSGFASRYCCWLPAPVWHRSGRYCARLCARATRRRSASSP